MSSRTAEKKTAIKNSLGRLTFAIIAITAQVVWLVYLLKRISEFFPWMSWVITGVSIILALGLYGRKINAEIKMPWIMLILVFPVVGIILYLLIGLNGTTRKMRRRFRAIDEKLYPLMPQDGKVLRRLEEKSLYAANMSRYILLHRSQPVYQNTDVVFHNETLKALEDLKRELARAEKFIFMEYFAVEDAEAFHEISRILREKAAAGVDVRLFYDDVGSIGFVNRTFIRKMDAAGIRCRVFNPMTPVLNFFMNNRDHRKITVIDGKVAFTGGYNLADEYFNIIHPYGYWKDSGVMLRGEAVRSLTMIFLEMWNAVRDDNLNDEEFHHFLAEAPCSGEGTAFVQPYAESPIYPGHVAEDVYLNILGSAERYAYFFTPYLIITDEITRAFALAARRGVDVRIITPGIPDKKLIYRVTRSYYGQLVDNGVRIFEYSPGFCHAKQCVVDGKTAAVGTINLDYRSLYHHFENGVLVHDCAFAERVREDFEDSFRKSTEVTENYRRDRKRRFRLVDLLLRLIAPAL